VKHAVLVALGTAAVALAWSLIPASARAPAHFDLWAASTPPLIPSTVAPVPQTIFLPAPPPPSPRPTNTPPPQPTAQPEPSGSKLPAWGDAPTYQLDVRAKSPNEFSVYVECRRLDLTYPSFDSDGLALVVTSEDGSIHLRVPAAADNHGVTAHACDPYFFAVLNYQLSVPLRGSLKPYVITASTVRPFTVTSSSDILVTDVPRGIGDAVGSRYVGIESPGAGAVRTGELFRYAGRNVKNERVFISLEDEHDILTRIDNDPNDGLGPVFDGPDTAKLRRDYLNRPVATRNFEFTCYNAKHERARVKLLAGKHLRIAAIARAAHEMRWLPNDPRRHVYSYPCDGLCSEKRGTFVDSPIVVAITLEPGSVEVIPPTAITRPYLWSGNCIGGYVVLQSGAEFRDVFVPI
jgi:hypothetical protein